GSSSASISCMCALPSITMDWWISVVFAMGELAETTFASSVLVSVMNAPVVDCVGTVARTHASFTVTSAHARVDAARSNARTSLLSADERRCTAMGFLFKFDPFERRSQRADAVDPFVFSGVHRRIQRS